MPNIIEQQDLLKGLPDTRLALLLQKPTGDIPPFLVAAEAQRRQAIRQQYSGDGNKESVVDTLTKQMANVPQNVQAPMQAPPQMPPPQGIAALQQPQQMAGGGAVAASSLMREQEQPWDYGLFNRVYDYVAPSFTTLGENLQKFGFNPTEDQKKQLQENSNSPVDASSANPEIGALLPDKKIVAGRNPLPPPPKDPGKKNTSPSNQAKDIYKYQDLPAEFRQRIEDLYAPVEPTGMENAQAWFDMSAQFLDPSKTTMQSIAGAGQAFTQARAQQQADQRAAERERERALLEYDIGRFTDRRDYEQQLANAKIAAEQKMLERSTPSAGNILDYYSALIRAENDKMDAVDAKMIPEEDKAKEKAIIQSRIDAINARASAMIGGNGVITVDQLRQSLTGQ